MKMKTGHAFKLSDAVLSMLTNVKMPTLVGMRMINLCCVELFMKTVV